MKININNESPKTPDEKRLMAVSEQEKLHKRLCELNKHFVNGDWVNLYTNDGDMILFDE